MTVGASLPENLRQALARTGTFTVRVMPSERWWAIRQHQHQALPWHDTVLRPLLAATTSAWVYELREDTEVFAIAQPLLKRERGKHAIDLAGEAIQGYELLWNASGGARGSIVLMMPIEHFPAEAIFPHCEDAFVIGNPTTPHTPSAIRFARSLVEDGRTLCCLLSRTNGFEWFSIHAGTEVLERLLVQARTLVVKRAAYVESAD